jgi:Ca-activated chloride channel family protein
MSWLEAFHFLRPLWLLAVPAILLTWYVVRRRESAHRSPGDLVAPHLVAALTINSDSHTRLRPVDVVAVATLSMALAAAGPTWSKRPSPWFAETAPLVVAFEVSDSMRANDLQPTRLDRARFKVLDLIGQRTGSRTAVIAYDGSAHVVLPPSLDINVLKPLLESLDPEIMPVKGTRASSVLPVALNLLGEETAVGTLLFVTDGFDPADIEDLARFSATAGTPKMAALVIGTEAGGVALLPDGAPVTDDTGKRIETGVDMALIRRAERDANVDIVRVRPGDDDIRSLLRVIASNLRQADDPDARWKDAGWWFLWPAALLLLFGFRRGWSMQW